jgi:hypothetical protein
MVISAWNVSQSAMTHGVVSMTKRKDLKLDKLPTIVDTDKETPQERLIKLRFFLAAETTANGNTLYAQDLKETITQIENRG